MALTLKDRVLESSISTGTGDFVLAGAQTGYQTFGVAGDGATVPYTIQGKNIDGTLTGDWEVGIGTYTLSTNSISRDTVLESSNSNAKVFFPAGDKDIFLDIPGERIVQSPIIAVSSNFVAYDGVTGQLLKDSGSKASDFATSAQGAKADTAVQQAVVGQPNGVASLDSTGKVPTSQIPQMGDLNYQGTWNASTNTPTLASGTGTKGFYYVVSVSGSTNLDGITDWVVGDWAVFNGTVWQKIDNTDLVTSVNGYTGAVTLTYSDVGAANAPVNTNITSMTGITGGISTADYITFDTTYATPLTAGQIGWDGNNTLGIGMIGGNVTQHIGEDQFFYCKATSAITKGQVVMFTGAVGASGVPTGAPATSITDGTYIMGIAAENIAFNGFGLVQSFGTLKNFNTTGYVDGDILWYNPAVTGGLTKTKPSAPNVKVQMAAVINGGSSGGGTILIRINPGSTLGGTDSNAQIGAEVNGQIITYDGGNGYWKNTSLVAGTAISVSTSANGVLTIANTAPDQVVSLTGAGTTTVTGSYPSFTITSNDAFTGTVTSVTGTSPISVATGTTTPVVSMTQASGSVNGWLSSTDWTTFNNKQPAGAYLTTVTADAPLSGSGTSGSHLVISQANTTTNGYLSSTDWSTFNGKQAALVSGTNIKTVNGTTLLGSGDLGTIGLAYGGTGVTTAPAAFANIQGFTTTATAAGTTTLTNTSSVYQIFTGTTTQTIVLPVTTTLAQGWTFHIVNNSTGNLTVNSSGANLVVTVLPGTTAMVTCVLASGTTAASWKAGLTDLSAATSTQSGYLTSTDWTTFNSKASLSADQTWTGAQAGTVTTANTGSFDMTLSNNFKCTPTGTFALTFTNITAGQSGYVLLVNTSGFAVTAAATTKVNSIFLATVSTAGTYLISYFTDGTNVYCTTGGAMA